MTHIKSKLLNSAPKVVNIGLELFAQSIKQQNGKVVHIAWRPPADGDKKMMKLLDKLL
jgi:hypothetical protein